MAIVTTDNQYYSAIADAIRAKNGTETTYKPADMAAAIAAIPTGGGGSGGEDWVRPSEWFDIKSLFEAESDDWVGAYLLYDGKIFLDQSVIRFDGIDTGSTIEVYTISDDGSLTLIDTITSGGSWTATIEQQFYVVKVTGSNTLYINNTIQNKYDSLVEAYLQGIKCGFQHRTVQHIVIKNETNTTLNNKFYNCSALQKVEFINCDYSNVSGVYNTFSYCFLIKDIDMTDTQINLSDVSSDDVMFDYCYSLQTIKFPNTTINIGASSFLFSANPAVKTIEGAKFYRSVKLYRQLLLSGDSIRNIINGLIINTSITNTITFSYLSLSNANLTPEEIAIATSKNWTIAVSTVN